MGASAILGVIVRCRILPVLTLAATIAGCAVPPPDFDRAPIVDAAGSCALRNTSTDHEFHLGFPRNDDSLSDRETINVSAIAVDFSDAPGSDAPDGAMEESLGDLPDLVQDVSYGALEVRMDYHPEWLRMRGESTSYDVSTAEGMRSFVAEALDVADPGTDFTSTDVVMIMAPPQSDAVDRSSFLSINPRSSAFIADGRSLTNLIVFGADVYDDFYYSDIHELGHALGLPDLYLVGKDGLIGLEGNPYVGDFGFMGGGFGTAPEPFAYERWLLGWIQDSQIACVVGDGGIRLTAVEVEGGIKAAIVPIDSDRLLVVESRRRTGHDSRMSEEGALVYVVDVSVASGQGPLMVYPEAPESRTEAPLGVGESIMVEGITVTVIWSGGQSDIVDIDLPEEG